MNKRAYIFCLVAAVIVATFVIGYNIGTDKQSKKNNSQTNAKVIEKGEPIFVRLDSEEEIEYIKSQMKL